MVRTSWTSFVADIDALIKMMGPYRPDIIVPSMCGGLVPAGILAEKLGIKDVRLISIEQSGEARRIVYDLQGDIAGKKILLLEDDLPSGKGFLVAKALYEGRGAHVKIAAVYVNAKSRPLADYFGRALDPLPNLPWKPARAGDRIIKK